jgi:hypothetical protein
MVKERTDVSVRTLYGLVALAVLFEQLGAANHTDAAPRASHGLGAVGLLWDCRSKHRDVPSVSKRLHPKGPLSGEARHPDRL